MLYQKISLELIVLAEDAEAVTRQLNTTLDALDEHHSLFGGAIETTAFHRAETPNRSALTHTRNAGDTAIKAARKGLTTALRAII